MASPKRPAADDTIAHNGRTANGSSSLTSRHDNTRTTSTSKASTSGTVGESRTSTSSARSVPGVTKVSDKKVSYILISSVVCQC